MRLRFLGEATCNSLTRGTPSSTFAVSLLALTLGLLFLWLSYQIKFNLMNEPIRVLPLEVSCDDRGSGGAREANLKRRRQRQLWLSRRFRQQQQRQIHS